MFKELGLRIQSRVDAFWAHDLRVKRGALGLGLGVVAAAGPGFRYLPERMCVDV